jgi:hypothetical protein
MNPRIDSFPLFGLILLLPDITRPINRELHSKSAPRISPPRFYPDLPPVKLNYPFREIKAKASTLGNQVHTLALSLDLSKFLE